MPVIDHGGDNPELLLVGADRPRPLPPELRARLEGVLIAGRATAELPGPGLRGTALEEMDGGLHGGTGPRRLPAPARDWLETSLSSAPEPIGQRRRRWGLAPSSLGAAAAVVVALAVGLPVLAHPGGAGNGLSALGSPRTGEHALPKGPGVLYSKSFGKDTTLAPTVAPGRTSAKPGSPPGKQARQPGSAPGNQANSTSTHKAAAPGSMAMTNSRAGAPEAISLAGIQPASGPATGGNWALLTGSGLSKVTTVEFGNVPASRVQVLSPLEVRVLVPAHRPGLVPVVVVSVAVGVAVAGGHGHGGASSQARYRFAGAR